MKDQRQYGERRTKPTSSAVSCSSARGQTFSALHPVRVPDTEARAAGYPPA